MSFEFPWQEDEDGPFLAIRSDEVDRFEIRRQNSYLFLFTGKLALYDHIWVEMPELGETEETVMGARVWQRSIDKKFGEGAFRKLCDDMQELGFMESDDDEPSELDIQAFHNTFPNLLAPDETDEDALVLKLMHNFAAHWKYMQGEPGWQV